MAVRRLDLTVPIIDPEGNAIESKFRFHDLRHVFASWLHNSDVDLDRLRVILGHKDRKTTDQYATLNKKAVGDSLALLLPLDKGNKKALKLIKDQG